MASALVAALLSFLVVGFGQIYNGQALKGIFLMFLAVASVFMAGPFLVWIVWLVGIVDAYRVASHRVVLDKSAINAISGIE